MKRILLAAMAVAGAAIPATAQDLSGNIASGFSSGLSGDISGGVRSGFRSGLGTPDRNRDAQTDDFTLGSTGTLRPSQLQGQPSNYGASFQSMAPIDQRLTFDNGPATQLDLGQGPAGPID